MYSTALILHSVIRWLVLVSLMVAAFAGYQGWKKKKTFGKADNLLRIVTLSVTHTQLALGVILYLTSPITGYFVKNFKEAVHIRDMRFFGMEHVTMMVIAVVLISIGSAKIKKKKEDEVKVKAMAVWFTIALVIIFLSIPWPFSPFTSRPWVRY